LDRLPPIDARLVAVLGLQFRDQAPDLSMVEKEVWFAAGQASVVRWLEAKCREQQEGLLVNMEGL